MTAWVVAVVAAIALAILPYSGRESRRLSSLSPLVALRAVALGVLAALLLDAPAGRRRASAPIIALDASASWLRGGDTSAWRTAYQRARTLSRDSLFLIGDSVRIGSVPDVPTDNATRIRPLVEEAVGSGRSVVVITDGELDDPSALALLPSGSRVEVVPRRGIPDVALLTLEAPRAIVSDDTIEAILTIRSGEVPMPPGRAQVLLGGRLLGAVATDSMPARSERRVVVRAPTSSSDGTRLLSAVVSVDGDAEHRNDTLAVPIDVTRAAGAVLVSTSPDFDARYVAAVLRGAVSLPTRGYFRVAREEWRRDGTLAPVAERDVRRALRDAPLAILHGDTALFGPPRSATTGALVLLSPPADTSGEWFPVAAPPSPIAAALSGIPWDSLSPIAAARVLPRGEWEGLVVARSRQFERRPVISGSARPRRVVVVGGSGFWRWRFRGGQSADAYATMWGSIFDWLLLQRTDVRGAVPADGIVREGERVRWVRGVPADSVVVLSLVRRGADAGVDSLMLHFGPGASMAESEPLPAGIYDVRVRGGSVVLAVNASPELLPRAATAVSGTVGRGGVPGDAPRLRDRGWPYLLILAALCAEWLLRRRAGLR